MPTINLARAAHQYITPEELAMILEAERNPAPIYTLMRAAKNDWLSLQILFASAYPPEKWTPAMRVVFAKTRGEEVWVRLGL
jgi:predicted TIM-barrel fold metal-dependent hydrolase